MKHYCLQEYVNVSCSQEGFLLHNEHGSILQGMALASCILPIVSSISFLRVVPLG